MERISVELLMHLKQLLLFIPHSISLQNFKMKPNAIDLGDYEIHLPLTIDPQSVQVLENSQEKVIKVKWIPSSESESVLNSGAESWILTKDDFLSLKGIYCKGCAHPLMDAFPFQRIMDTPSEYWHELLDCWACHNEDYTKLKGQKAGHIYAQPDCLLVASSYILLHPSNLNSSLFKISKVIIVVLF
jgi:hypothetical protein